MCVRLQWGRCLPFQHGVAIDIVHPFPSSKGYTYLLTYIRPSSKYPEAIPMHTAEARECAQALLEMFSCNGVPSTILSDQVTQFMSYLMKCICEGMGTLQIRTTYRLQNHDTVNAFTFLLVCG